MGIEYKANVNPSAPARLRAALLEEIACAPSFKLIRREAWSVALQLVGRPFDPGSEHLQVSIRPDSIHLLFHAGARGDEMKTITLVETLARKHGIGAGDLEEL